MERRQFIHRLAWGSMALGLPLSFRRAQAAGENDRLLVTFDADGAWDPTYFCDPHGDRPSHTFYSPAQILTNSAGLTYAPKTISGRNSDVYRVANDADFFAKWADEMVVFRGLETLTNAHEVGVRHVWSGFKNGGYPSLGALLGAVRGSEQPMAYLSTGGYDVNGGLVHTTRIGRVEPLMAAARPNRVALAGNDERTFHSLDTMAAIQQAQDERTQRLLAQASLPYAEKILRQLQNARGMEASFEPLLDRLKSLPALTNSQQANPLIAQAQVVFAGLSVGVTSAANLSLSGFDSHTKHDDPGPLNGHRPRLQELFEAIDYFLDLAKTEPSVYSRLVVVAGSDFGRSRYNSAQPNDRGKDHWPITSLMAFGPLIGGGRVIGATTLDDADAGPIALPLAPNLEVTTPGDAQGQALRPAHIHLALRQLLGVDQNALSARYPLLRGEGLTALPLFA